MSLVLEVEPIREDAEYDREALVLKLREKFGESRSKAISKIYIRIKRCGKKIVDFDDIDSIAESVC